jgi:hypothetical protein
MKTANFALATICLSLSALAFVCTVALAGRVAPNIGAAMLAFEGFSGVFGVMAFAVFTRANR